MKITAGIIGPVPGLQATRSDVPACLAGSTARISPQPRPAAAGLRAFGAALTAALLFYVNLDTPSSAMEANTDVHCADMQHIGSPMNDENGIFVIGLLRGFILGANAANPTLLEMDIWSRFAETLHSVCQAEPSLRFIDALHRAFEKIRDEAP